MTIVLVHKYKVSQISFAVLTGNSSVSDAPVKGQRIKDESFVPGMTVRIISTTGEWVLIERFDGVRAWLVADEIYPLHTRESQHNAPQADTQPKR